MRYDEYTMMNCSIHWSPAASSAGASPSAHAQRLLGETIDFDSWEEGVLVGDKVVVCLDCEKVAGPNVPWGCYDKNGIPIFDACFLDKIVHKMWFKNLLWSVPQPESVSIHVVVCIYSAALLPNWSLSIIPL